VHGSTGKTRPILISLNANGQIESSVDGAAVSGVVISGLEVCRRASMVTSLANGLGASGGHIRGLNREALVGELVARLHVDARQVPEDGVTGSGVLELEDIVLLWVEGQFDGNTTAVGVGAPVLRVNTAAAVDGLHGADVASNGPGVYRLVEVVGDLDTAAITADHTRAADHHVLGKGRGNGGEKGSKAESLCEHHFECGM
jgi:hypothetical protein